MDNKINWKGGMPATVLGLDGAGSIRWMCFLVTCSPSLTIMASLNGTRGTTGLDTPNVEITFAVTTCIIFETFLGDRVVTLGNAGARR